MSAQCAEQRKVYVELLCGFFLIAENDALVAIEVAAYNTNLGTLTQGNLVGVVVGQVTSHARDSPAKGLQLGIGNLEYAEACTLAAVGKVDVVVLPDKGVDAIMRTLGKKHVADERALYESLLAATLLCHLVRGEVVVDTSLMQSALSRLFASASFEDKPLDGLVVSHVVCVALLVAANHTEEHCTVPLIDNLEGLHGIAIVGYAQTIGTHATLGDEHVIDGSGATLG